MKFTAKYLCRSRIFNRVADLQLTKRLRERCLTVSFFKVLRTLISKNTCKWIILAMAWYPASIFLLICFSLVYLLVNYFGSASNFWRFNFPLIWRIAKWFFFIIFFIVNMHIHITKRAHHQKKQSSGTTIFWNLRIEQNMTIISMMVIIN